MTDKTTQMMKQMPTATAFLDRQLDNLSITGFEVPTRTLPRSANDYELSSPLPVALLALDEERPPMLLDLMGSVKLGHNTPLVDVDLTMWHADQQGVSREHAMIRPRPNKLWVIDLGSTNGTYVNGLPLSPSRAYELSDKDVLTLGEMHIGVHML